MSNGLVSDCFTFADDASIFRQYQRGSEIQTINTLENDLLLLSRWADEWKMKFNYAKTNLANFTKLHNYSFNFSLKFGNTMVFLFLVLNISAFTLGLIYHGSTTLIISSIKVAKLLGYLKETVQF